ncbi:bifunctional riboflavin kinase/FAD synthetase [Robertmurraya sp. DFI.2.37]|uniref:bifunctional riboflavin kinase/FAD synthetase n=1 Tax=Robertmurraya sp. DFI.2.37 TaxID=3031819 RepID=UPI001248F348|nr:bifunctional riboflavin kinase/FAD synthetase [Robertmurraya sp. DFI.2.37]MDF1510452.1 bifunctional riboflavin kinase/FAD synthetase [Robertmurraya sp. DFI.2.37]
MEVIHIHHPHQFKPEHFAPMTMALGFFDGVHYGHQEVINTAAAIAKKKNCKVAVMTFDPHPSVVLRRDIKHVEYITPLKEKARLIEQLHVDYLFVVHFTSEFANLLPQEFVDQYLIALNVIHVVAGFDYSYGRLGKGTMETLPFHSRGKFEFTTVPKLSNGHEKISSTLIRKLIREGDVERIPDFLGRFYTTSGIVIHGDKRGRTIGFPTANTAIDDSFYLPPTGVYAVRILVADKWYEGVCNIGYKPTFNETQAPKPSVEVHIFQFTQEIYGYEVVIEWHKRIRAEKKFNGIEELVQQIEKDKASTIDYFNKI